MIEPLSDAGGWIVIGVCLVCIGALIRVREWTFLIAGYDASAAVPQGVAVNVVGNLLIRVGVVAGILGVVRFFSSGDVFGVLFALFVVVDLVRVMYRLTTYDRNARPH